MKRQQLGKIRGGLRALRWPLGVLGAAGALVIVAGLWSAPADAQVLTVEDLEEIQFGSDLFNFETWDGNGRTCGTCHRREDQYNVYPDTIAHMSTAEKDLLCAANVPGLENRTLCEQRALFNTEAGIAADLEADQIDADGHHPVFRSTMTVGPLGPDAFPGPGSDVAQTIFAPGLIAPPVPPPIPDHPELLGWSGNGSPLFGHHGTVANDDLVTEAAPGTALNFCQGAVAQHSTLSLDRIVGVDFRFPTMEEAEAIDKFQRWLGRREEFPINTIVFAEDAANDGREFYESGEAGCDACHTNGGATGPFPPGQNLVFHTEAREEAPRLIASTGVFIPEDEGVPADPLPPPLDFDPTQEPGAFNTQPFIEAAFKKGWFHLHNVVEHAGGDPALEGEGFESAIAFYFRPPFVGSDAFLVAQFFGLGGAGRPTSVAELNAALGDSHVIEKIGAFGRALGAWYKVRDCERLVEEAIFRINNDLDPDLPADHCTFNLDDANEAILGNKVSGRFYRNEARDARTIKADLRRALRRNDISRLEEVLDDLVDLRQAIAFVPEVDGP